MNAPEALVGGNQTKSSKVNRGNKNQPKLIAKRSAQASLLTNFLISKQSLLYKEKTLMSIRRIDGVSAPMRA